MSDETAHLVDTYAGGGERVAMAITGWSEADLARIPPESAAGEVGKWSVHQLLIHLQDAEASFADRIRRVIAMDEPQLLAWDEGRYVERLNYGEQSAGDAVKLIELTRGQVSRILKKLTDSDFERIGVHSHRGPQKLSAIIGFADWHLDHHLSFVKKKRASFVEFQDKGGSLAR